MNSDWEKLNEIRIFEWLNPYLTKMFLGDCVNFTCNGWKILFLIKELALKELCFNFFSTVSFAANTIDPQYVSALAFCLGGQS